MVRRWRHKRLGGVSSAALPAQLAGFRAGSVVAGYRLEAQVGAGGMAVVFRAREEQLRRLVALKVLVADLAADREFRRRFIAESRAAAAVDDPHIIPVYRAGEAGGVLFIAMRFVEGGDLRLALEREGPLRLGRAAAFLSPVASALDAAHRAGIIHRDVKPANILVDARPGQPDHVYLSDFGVSKTALSAAASTRTGQFLGTPDYAAPEQIQGRAVDGRVDQYALACVAFQLLTGTVPFRRDHDMAVLLAHLSEPPPSLTSRRPDLPGTADRVLARALAKDPEKRYGSCREFVDALREALDLAPHFSGGPAAASHHPPTRITPRPGPPETTAAGTAVAPADPAAAVTVDSLPGGSRADTRSPGAEGTYREAIRLNPADAAAHRSLGNALLEAARYPEAEAAYREAIRLNPANAAAHNDLGVILGLRHYPADAEAAYREAIRLDPAYALPHSNLGSVLREAGRYPEAEAAYREAIRLNPGYPVAHNNLGVTLASLHRPAEAEAAYWEAIRLDPAYAQPRNNLGDVLREAGRYAEAEAAYREAIRVDPAYVEAHHNLGVVLGLQHRYSEAEVASREAVRLDPAMAEAHASLGVTLCGLGRYPEAEAAFREAIRVNPAFTAAHELLGDLLPENGRDRKAEGRLRGDPPEPG